MQQEIETGKKDLHMFLTDVQEEIMDALLYIEAAKRCLTDEIEEAMINRHKSFNDNISNIDIYDEKEL